MKYLPLTLAVMLGSILVSTSTFAQFDDLYFDAAAYEEETDYYEQDYAYEETYDDATFGDVSSSS
ncbi:MAG: hypothetical protein AAFR14_00640 [Bacteroidota bacterium]